MVNDSTVRLQDKEGNDAADRIAKQAMQLHGKEVIETAAILSARHLKYTEFVRWLHEKFLRALKNKRDQIQKKVEEANSAFSMRSESRKEKSKNEYIHAGRP
eukprot:11860904-Karenia_brevis.AAC.1